MGRCKTPFKKGDRMYGPKIGKDLIPRLYRTAKMLNKPIKKYLMKH